MLAVLGDEDGSGSMRVAKCASPPKNLLLLLAIQEFLCSRISLLINCFGVFCSFQNSTYYNGAAQGASWHPDTGQGFGEEEKTLG